MAKSTSAGAASLVLVAAFACACTSHKSSVPTGKATAPGSDQALVDVRMTPTGWSPIAYRTVQISVPGGWLIENPGTVCGSHDAGRVFIAERPRLPSGIGCGSATNVVTIGWHVPGRVADRKTKTVNGIGVVTGMARSKGRTTRLETALGVEIGATGPKALAVLRTFMHSALSVVLSKDQLAAPKTWRSVRFGGLRFAVPPAWQIQHTSDAGGCPDNLEPNRLTLSTATTYSTPGCPGPPNTAQYNEGAPSTVVEAGPKTPARPDPGATCLRHNMLRVCIDLPPLRGGYPVGRGLQILTAYVYPPGQPHPDRIEIGLSGTGQTPAEIFDSLRAGS